jgi:L-lactate dehydrogenase (cytochrome)
MSVLVTFAAVVERDLIVLHGKVYDLRDFAHPGGLDILRPLFGHDGTAAFDEHHSRDFLALAQKHLMGTIDPTDEAWQRDVKRAVPPRAVAGPAPPPPAAQGSAPPLASMLNAADFRLVAEKAMSPSGWAYYDSGGNSEATLRENERVFERLWLRPRVLVNVKHVDTSCTLLGSRSPGPLYVTATALAKLANPEGEVAIVRACHRANNVVYMLPTLSSCSLDEMTAAAAPGQPLWFQLYVNPNRSLTEEVVRRAESKGCRALFVTVDAPQLGRRERDMRFKATLQPDLQKNDAGVKKDQGTAQALSSFIDPSLCWDDLPWLMSLSRLPVVLKGVQRGEDAVMAVRRGCKALVLSNHGGRQQDYARSGTEVLIEVVEDLKREGLRVK